MTKKSNRKTLMLHCSGWMYERQAECMTLQLIINSSCRCCNCLLRACVIGDAAAAAVSWARDACSSSLVRLFVLARRRISWCSIDFLFLFLLVPDLYSVLACGRTHSLNLYELIKKNNYQGFSLNLIRRFAYSLVQCLRLLRRENIIHCDLKPVPLHFLIMITASSTSSQ